MDIVDDLTLVYSSVNIHLIAPGELTQSNKTIQLNRGPFEKKDDDNNKKKNKYT